MTISAVLLREMFNYNQLEYAQNLFSIVMVHTYDSIHSV